MIRIVKHPHLDTIGIRDLVPFDSPLERTPRRVSALLLLAKPTDPLGRDADAQAISADKPAYYRVLITSRLRPGVELIGGKQFVIASRMNTMEAESDVNLVRFLDTYGKAGAYSLVPAIWKGKGDPEFLLDLAILKRELSVKAASEVGDHDIEAMALGPRRRSEKWRKLCERVTSS